MSYGRVSAVIRLRGLSSSEFRVLMLLANHENDSTGKCNPSYNTLASESEMSSRYVKEIVESLRTKGCIAINRSKTKYNDFDSNDYLFRFAKEGGEPQFTTVVSHSSQPVVNHSSLGVVNHSSPKPRICNQEIVTENKNLALALAVPSLKKPSPCTTQESQKARARARQIQSFDEIINIFRKDGLIPNNVFILKQRYDELVKNDGYDKSGKPVKSILGYLRSIAKSAPMSYERALQKNENDRMADEMRLMEAI